MSGSMHVLSNGLTVAADPIVGAESVAIGLYASVGSRSEPEHLSGLAHLVEHMVFKGAGGRDTRALAEAIEDVGGLLEARAGGGPTGVYRRPPGRGPPVAPRPVPRPLPPPPLPPGHPPRGEKGV